MSLVLADRPAEGVLRITLNRPEKRNALSNALRAELLAALEAADVADDVRVSIIRGAGNCFSAGYDLASDLRSGQPYYTAGGLGHWARHVVEGCFRIWDLAKPVIAQVHGYCLAGGTELMAACDLAYVSETAQLGYPAVRSISPPDNQFYPWMIGIRRAAELMLTGDSISGIEAARIGLANASVPDGELDSFVLTKAARIAKVPSDIQQINKRSLHRQAEAMGLRAALRAGTEIQALALNTTSTRSWAAQLRKQGVTRALDDRDNAFGDYRTGNLPGSANA